MHDLLTRALHRLPPETAHGLAIRGLEHGLVRRHRADAWPSLATTFCGLELPNPLGLAAGFDKNAQALPGLAKLGFGFIEVGTVTPKPQPGNPRPRLFRLAEDRALINRMGFNGDGLERVRARLACRKPEWGVVGANIGANRDAADPVADYVTCLRALHPLVDYIAVNVSSPNTPGLRDLQHGSQLETLLTALATARAAIGGPAKPLLLKIAPDLDADQERAIAKSALAAGIDGLIVGNTTLARPAALRSHHLGETGGLSGAPLLAASTVQLARMYRLTGGEMPLVGVGGIASGADAYAKIRAGATALQLYTALIYGGPGLVTRVLAELATLIAKDGYARLADAVGTSA